MGLLSAIPFYGWLITFIIAFCLSVPFYVLWNWLAPTYFFFLPSVYLDLPFWHCVGLFMLTPLIRLLLQPVTVSVSQKSK